MRYFTNPANGKPFGYDENDPNDGPLISAAIKSKWVEVTATWPPKQDDLAVAWSSYQAKAQSALNSSDRRVLRCAEAGVKVPDDLKIYRNALKAIVGNTEIGDATVPLPVPPAHVEGT
jgi:hypothetical protein